MEENEVLTPNVETDAQDRGDAFLDGWEETPAVTEAADQPDAEIQDKEPPAESGEAEGEEEKAGAEEADRAGDDPAENAEVQEAVQEQRWEVNHLGERKTMRPQDITPELLQKGLDYDRIRGQYDGAKPVMSLMSNLAQRSGVSVEEYVRAVRTEAKRASGMGEDEARRAVDLEDREAAVYAKEAEEKAAADRREAGDAARERDIAEFAKAFPEIYAKAKSDPNALPDSVWEAVGGGASLTAAYAQYAVGEAAKAAAEAQARARAAEQNHKNTARSTGSMKSAGSDAKNKDAFLEGWES